MKPLFTVFFTLLFININAQLWEYTYDADSVGDGYGFANDVIQTQDNGYIMGGEVDLPTGAIRHHIQLKKTDENGNLLWSKIYDYGVIQDDRLAKVHEISGGDLLIGGSTHYPTNGILIMRTNSVGDTLWKRVIATPNGYNNTNFDLISNNQYLCFARNNTELKLIKTDAAGSELLNKTLEEYFIPKAAAELSNGDYILTGEKNGQLYLMRTNPVGDSIWTKKYQFGMSDFGSAVQPLANGDFLIGGAISGIAGYTPTVAKFDINGQLLWHTILINIVNPSGQVSDIELGSTGDIFVTGSFNQENFFSFQSGYLAKLDANGQNQVVDTFSTVNRTDGSALKMTNDGCLIVTGGNQGGYYLRKACNLTSTLSVNRENIKVDVYPNPMENVLHFSIDNIKFTNFDLIIYDVNGRIIHQEKINNQYEFRNNKLNSGIYFYTLSIDNQIISNGKFVKN